MSVLCNNKTNKKLIPITDRNCFNQYIYLEFKKVRDLVACHIVFHTSDINVNFHSLSSNIQLLQYKVRIL
jgi:hypothetical protein